MLRFPLAVCAAAIAAALPAAAQAQFPYAPQGAQGDYSEYKLPAGSQAPDDLSGKLDWMYASTPPPPPFDAPLVADARELNGVRGAWVVDKGADGKITSADQAWHTTTGRPDVTIAVLDSGVQWNEPGKPGLDTRLKTRISRGETPAPQANRATPSDPAVLACAPLAARAGGGERDLNADGVFNVLDYACDSRVDPNPPKGVGLPTMLDPQDILIAFTDGDDDDANGYADDMVGWDFLDDDNDPFDDVQYGHGSGEVQDSTGEADNGAGDLGSCPNCMAIHMRVGTSFIADVNRFALATMYATDNGVDVVQEALGTLNKSRIAFDAIKYAYDHGTTVIASAADEAAQHHNWPSSYPYSIVVNSVTHTDESPPDPFPNPTDATSYLQFNGCTNFSSRITLAIPSVSCSSDATGRAAGFAGLVYSAALNAEEAGALDPHSNCTRTDGSPCVITPNEVRQVMASGTFDGTPAADDVNFAQSPTGTDLDVNNCHGAPLPGCTDPFAPVMSTAPRATAPVNYPARKGHDQFYGYGRANMAHAVDHVMAGTLPPEVEVTSPDWYDFVDPGASDGMLHVRGQVWNRGADYKCTIYVAPGSYPKDTAAPDGDFVKFDAGACNSSTRSARLDGELGQIPIEDIEALFPADTQSTGFEGSEGGAGGQTPNQGTSPNVGRPNDEPYGFTVKVVATTTGANPLEGADRRQAYLHRDQDMVDGFPRQLPGDIEASPVLADLDGDNRNELLVANSDGLVHAWRRDGSELPGYPFHTDAIPMHAGSRAVSSGAIATAYGAVLGTPAVGDLDHDGTLEVVVADLESKVYVLDGETGALEKKWRTRIEYSGKPLEPFVNVRGAAADGHFDKDLAHLHRMQHGFIASPVLADVDRNDGGRLEIVGAALDRHVYVWNDDGSDVPGWPLVFVDHKKLRAQSSGPRFDPVTQRPFFNVANMQAPGKGRLDQGAIVDTPAVGDLVGDGKPEIVVGTNESYHANVGDEGPLNAGGLNEAAYAPLGAALALANGRLFAVAADGDPGGNPNDDDQDGPWLPGWPFKVGILQAGLLPLVGEGITGSPIMGSVPCQGTTRAPRVGTMPAAGVAYLVNPDGQSCYGRPDGRDVGMNSEGGAGDDQPFLAAVGHPAFAELAGGTAMLAPAAGVQRAADVVLPEYQGGQDYLVAWDLQQPQGNIKQGWPAIMNDLQFLEGPSAADISPAPGDEVLNASAHHDLQGFLSTGQPVAPNWPKATGDWSVANPTIGSFGTLDTQDAAKLVVAHGTRNGRLSVYASEAPACSPASWPRFHHDLANSGDLRRDATPPGKPMDAASGDGKLTWTAPGDDLLCGTAKSYEIVTSDDPITPASFAGATPLSGAPDPTAPGSGQSYTLPAETRRYVAVRAVDEQGNVGRPASVGATVAPPASQEQPPQGVAPPAPGTAPVSKLVDKNGCVPRKLVVGRRGIGPIRLGQTSKRTLERVGAPPNFRKGSRVWKYCVRGGGRLALIFSRGRIRLLSSTARGHEAAGHAGPGDPVRKIKRLYRAPRRYGRGINFRRGARGLVFRERRRRVRSITVADRGAFRNARLLRRYLRVAGL